MIHLDLDEEERKALDDILHSCLSDLSYEIASTDNLNYREQMKARRAVLMKIRDALEQSRSESS